MISVCLVDDQTLVRQGIRSLLELSDSIRELRQELAAGRNREVEGTQPGLDR